MDLNKATVIGNVTRDPETRTTPTGHTVANFSIATNFTWTDQSGQRQQKAEFHNIVAWRKLAEICQQYLRKGSKIYIEGRLETRSWEDKDSGKKQYRTEIIADNMIMLDRASDSPAGGAPQSESPADDSEPRYEQAPQTPAAQPQATAPQTPAAPAPSNNQVTEEEINVEDIPF